MINKPMKARVCWVKKEAGGPETSPPGPRYSTVARFEEEKEKWPHEAWSLVLEFHNPPDESHCLIAEVSLLNPDGPTGYFTQAVSLNCMRAINLVARGEVL